MPFARRRAVLAGAVALAAMAPALVSWTAPTVSSHAATVALPCGEASEDLPWQETPVPPFPGVDDVTTRDRIANFSVQSNTAARQIVTNGVTVQASTTNGCSWRTSFTLGASPGPGGISGLTSRITAPLLLRGGRGLLAIREGSGPASRPRVLASVDGTSGSWAPSETGLPAQGAPGVLVAAEDGRTVYLTIDPTGSGGDDGGTGVPPLPPVGGSPSPPGAGLVYASTDGGRTWSLRTEAGDLPGGDRRISDFVIDRGNNDLVYAVAGGQLLKSTNGARSFQAVPGVNGVRAVVTLGPGQVAAFQNDTVVYTANAFADRRDARAPGGITSAAYRPGDDYLAVEASGGTSLIDPRTGAKKAAKANSPVRPGSMSADSSGEATFHAIADHALIRYVDPAQPGTDDRDQDRVPEGVERPPPPLPGSISPSSLTLRLEEGDSQTVNYVLDLPKNPTPLDVMYLVDVSPTMQQYIEDLQRRITDISRSVVRQKIDLHAGVAFLTTGPSRADRPYPEVDPLTRGYKKPEIYKLLRKIGPPNAEFAQAVGALEVRYHPSTYDLGRPREQNYDPAEAQVLALDQLVNGDGVSLLDTRGVLSVPAGQDAGWRQNRFVRRLIVHATDQAFINNTGEWPAGSPEVEGKLNIDGTAELLRGARILHLGIDPRGDDENANDDATPHLTRVSLKTGSLAPPGGAVCDPKSGTTIPAGEPLVCGEAADFGDALISVLRSLADLQDVSIRTTAGSEAVSAISAAKLKRVNVTVDNRLEFSVTYSCLDIAPGRYLSTLETRLRGSTVGSTRTDLTCVRAQAPVIRPLPPTEAEPGVAPPPQPGQPVALPPAPAAPVAQPQLQPQVQVQVQVNPMTAAMMEQQQQLQLAAALNDNRPADETEMAMVDRQSRQETPAQLVLLVSMAAASVAGVARLRSDRARDAAVRRAR